MIEKQKQAKLGARKKKVENNHSVLKETRERLIYEILTNDIYNFFFRLLESISKLEHFRKFLETAVNQSEGEFLEVKQMIDRIMILVEIRLLSSLQPSSQLTVRLL